MIASLENARSALAERLRRGSTPMVVGNAVQQLSQLAVLAIFARQSGPESAGAFVTALALCAPLIMLANLQLNVDMAARDEAGVGFRDYLAIRGAALASVLTLALASAYAVLGSSEFMGVLSAVAAYKAVGSLSDLCGAWRLRHKEPAAFGRSLMLRGGLLAGAAAVVSWFDGHLVVCCSVTAVLWLIVLVVHDLPPALIPDIQGHLVFGRTARRLRVARQALPLGIVSLVGALELSLPRYAAAAMLGMASAGALGVAAALTTGGQLIMAAMIHTHLPGLAQELRSNNVTRARLIRRQLVMKTLGVGAVQTALLAFIAPNLQRFVFSEITAPRSVIIMISIGMSLMSVAAVISSCLRAERRYWSSLAGQTGSLAITAASCVIGVLWGLTGIAMASVVYGVASVLLFSIIEKRVSIRAAGGERHQPATESPRLAA